MEHNVPSFPVCSHVPKTLFSSHSCEDKGRGISFPCFREGHGGYYSCCNTLNICFWNTPYISIEDGLSLHGIWFLTFVTTCAACCQGYRWEDMQCSSLEGTFWSSHFKFRNYQVCLVDSVIYLWYATGEPNWICHWEYWGCQDVKACWLGCND